MFLVRDYVKGGVLSMLEAWETELFDKYNGEAHYTQEEAEADAFDELMYDKWEEER